MHLRDRLIGERSSSAVATMEFNQLNLDFADGMWIWHLH